MSLLQYDKIDITVVNNTGSTPFHSFCQAFSSPNSLRKVSGIWPVTPADVRRLLGKEDGPERARRGERGDAPPQGHPEQDCPVTAAAAERPEC